MKSRFEGCVDPPPLPCGIEEGSSLLDHWVHNRTVELPPVHKEPTKAEHDKPNLYIYHRILPHPTATCVVQYSP